MLRGDNGAIRLQAMSNVRDNCVLHSFPGGMTVLGRYAQGGHGAVRHGCILMETSMVGIHATLLDGVIVGENRLVSAQALCTKGINLEPGSL